MASIQVYTYAVVNIDGRKIDAGSLSEANSIAITDDEPFTQTYKVAPTTALKVWDSTENSAMGGFDLFWISSDFDVSIQCTTDPGVTDSYDVKTLKGSGTANKMGIPIILGSDVTKLLDGSIDTFDGSAGTVGEVWVYNADSTETARVFVMAFT